ncbi:MAG: hypothetical protein QW611_05510 [Ignisphaera sp.]
MVKLYTPGHNIITDSLIMHGVLRILGVLGYHSGVVQRVGERFIIDIEGLDQHSVRDLGSKFRNTDVYHSLQLTLNLYINKGYMPRDQKVSKIFESNPNEPANRSWATNLSESLLNLDLSNYLSSDHITSVNEGRRKGVRTLYISLSSIYGKYQELDYNTIDKPYSVCDTCFGLASLGLIYGALATVLRRENNKYSLFMTIIPEDRIEIRDLLIIQRLLEGYMTMGRFSASAPSDIPLLALPLYSLSVGETLAAIESEADVLTWKVAKVGNFIRSLDTALIRLNKLMDFITEVKMLIPEWPRIVSQCFETEDGFTILSELTEVIVFSREISHIYSTVRSIISYIEDMKDTTCKNLLKRMHRVSEKLVETITKVVAI